MTSLTDSHPESRNDEALKRDFQLCQTILLCFLMVNLIVSVSGVSNVSSLIRLFSENIVIGYLDIVFCLFVLWRSWKAQRQWGFLNYEEVKKERSQLKRNKYRYTIPQQDNEDKQSQHNENGYDSAHNTGTLSKQQKKRRTWILIDLGCCEWMLSSKAQYSFRWYIAGTAICAITFIIPNKEFIAVFRNILWGVGDLIIIVAFFMWIVSIIEAA